MSDTPSSQSQPSDAATSGIALKVGIQFVKTYYKILSTQPEMMERFYAGTDLHDATSYLSHGEGSDPTDPVPLEELKNHEKKSSDLSTERWGCNDDEKMLFEFEDGAIDAQPATNGGVLLVVTACVIFKSSDIGDTRRKKFVQTFFLAKFGRNFSVINDILRFLVAQQQQQPASSPVKCTDATSAAAVAAKVKSVTTDSATNDEVVNATDRDVGEKEKNIVVQSTKPLPASKTSATDNNVEDVAPGGGVEESKEEAPFEKEEAPAVASSNPSESIDEAKKKAQTTSVKDGKSKKNKSGASKQLNQQQAQTQPATSKPAPGSWASLVVSGGSAPNTPSRNAPQSEKKSQLTKPPLPTADTKEADFKEIGTLASKETTGQVGGNGSKNLGSKSTTNANSNSNHGSNSKHNSGAGGTSNSNNKTSSKSQQSQQQQQQQRTKRDPDHTLVIKNLSDNVKEHDIINMFQPYATQTKSKIVGTNLNHHRSLAFVDYDCVAPVHAVLKKHAETPFQWNGKILEVDQKTLEQRARRTAGLGKSGGHNGYRGGGAGSGNGNTGQFNRRSSGGGGGGVGVGGDRGGRRRGSRAAR